jgi:hypothetical protein
MLSVGNLLILGGYVLVYAAVANGGVMATNPWQGLFQDAYGVGGSGTYDPGAVTRNGRTFDPAPSATK